ncbi:MAG TPA: PKD domain-containing protein, partial [Acidimicrobiales bacterium]|nr:PKD domain-containing protein [Acidimicrobiales bacterium]
MTRRETGIAAAAAVVVLVFIGLLVAVTRGGDSGDGPSVAITRLEAIGNDAVLEIDATADSGPVEIEVDWGDGSPLQLVRGEGLQTFTHQYPLGPVNRVVTVTATDDDGNTDSTGRAITLGSATDTTAPADSTTTTAPADTTTTTAPPETTTTSSTTTSTTTTTTTTLPPEPTERVFTLSLADADFEPETTNEASAGRSSGTVSVRAISDGLDPGSQARAILRWRIAPNALAPLGDAPQVGVLFEPSWQVTLDTGRNRGRSARADIELSGTFGGASIGTGTDSRSIGNDDRLSTTVTDRIGFGSPAPSGGGGLNIELVLVCTAQPGETLVQIGEESVCSVDLTGDVRVTVRR